MVLENKSISIGDRNLTLDLGELLFPSLVLAFSIYYFYNTNTLPRQSMLYANPILFITVAFAIFVTLVHGVKIEREKAEVTKNDQLSTSAVEATKQEEEQSDSPYFTKRTASALVIMSFAYFLLLPMAGFMPVTAAFISGTLYLFGERNWIYLALYSAGFTILVWSVFIVWLKIPLPTVISL
ncbi:tripartite tricarboxylate transporter TctB family protein [halophilic archaeon]|nr:tripartite tricarboxylate transporter TctB family protein [halophilic archaeon]